MSELECTQLHKHVVHPTVRMSPVDVCYSFFIIIIIANDKSYAILATVFTVRAMLARY